MQINKSLRTLFLLNSVFVFAGSLLGPLYAIYVQGIDNRIMSVSISWAVLIASSTFFTFFVGKYGDKVKEKEYLLAFGFLVRGLAWLGYLFVTNILGLILIQAILGLGEAFGTPSWNVLFAKHLDGHREIMDYSDWGMVSNIMLAIGTILGGAIITVYGFNYVFILMSLLAFGTFVGVIITPRRSL